MSVQPTAQSPIKYTSQEIPTIPNSHESHIQRTEQPAMDLHQLITDLESASTMSDPQSASLTELSSLAQGIDPSTLNALINGPFIH